MIKIGPAGTSGLGYPNALEKCKELNLDALECAFTYSVHMSNAQADEVGKLAKKLKIDLSVHAPYWINLNSEEKIKIQQSKKRILDSCERGHYLGAKYIVFHPAFYQKKTEEQAFQAVKTAITEMQKIITKNKWNVVLAPETTGKRSQFGNLDELLRLRKETKCALCVDFAHLKARNQKIDYDDIFNKLKPVKHVHSHFSGVEYTSKGERKHLMTPADEIRQLLKYIKKYKKDITIINESPDPFKDSIKTMKILKGLS